MIAMESKQIISNQQKSIVRTEKALNEARALIFEAMSDLKKGGTITAQAKLENYVRVVMAGG